MANAILLTDPTLYQVNTSNQETPTSITVQTLGANDGLRIYAIGSLLVNGAQENFDTYLYIAGSKIADLGVLTIPTNAGRSAYLIEYNLVNRGAPNSQIYHGQLWHGAPGSHNGATAPMLAAGCCVHGGGLATVDFSGARSVALRVKHSVSNASNDYQQYACLVERVVSEATVGGNFYVGSDNTFRDVVNTASETVAATFTIPGNTLQRRDWLRAWSGLNYKNNTGSAQDLTIKVYLGGTLVGNYTQSALSANTQRYGQPLWIYVANLDSQASQVTAVKYGGGESNTWGTASQGITFNDALSTFTSTVDMTQPQALEVKITHGAANANLSAQHYGTFVERLPGL